jgi:hypothetical protein
MSEKKSKLDGNPVEHPSHYTDHPSGIEAIEVCGEMGFNTGNAFKYLMRLDRKWDSLEDLKKSLWYVYREIFQRSGLSRKQFETKEVETLITNPTYNKTFYEDFASLDNYNLDVPFKQIENIKNVVATTLGNVGRAMFFVWLADKQPGIKKLLIASAYIEAEITDRSKLLN